MMISKCMPVCAFFLLIANPVLCGGAEGTARDADRDVPVRIGAVAYGPSTVTVFQGLTRYLTENDLPADFVLYSNYDALVDALDRGQVEIAWNTPLAHGQFHVRNQCASQTLVMRDVDFNFHSVLVARADSGIKSLADLHGKRLVLGSSQAAEATVLPLHFLKQEGVDVAQVQLVKLDGNRDVDGNPCDSPRHVAQALREGRGDAGIITAGLWASLTKQGNSDPELVRLWTSPAFSHCVFTASGSFDKTLADKFTQLMMAMDPQDPVFGEVMRLEGTRKWLPGTSDGFASLIDALMQETSATAR